MLNLSGQSLGRYHIIEPLGVGGMATVYKAFDTRLECDVAIKFIQHEHITPGQWQKMLKRFENEAKRMAKFTHPNIVKVTDYGEYNGTPYLVMEYLAGGTLKTLLKSRNGKPLSFHEAVHILLPIAHALDYTHRQDTIHRDVKPANILITDDGALMLTDFGVAKILDIDDGQTLTGANVGVGTPKYMAPEQWQNQISSQTDVYALGVVFYEMLTGHVPYDADTPAGIYAKQLTEPLTQPRAYVPDLPEEVEKVLYKAMAKKPEDRYKNMGAFVNALERLPQLPLSVSDKVDSTPVTNEYLSEQPKASVGVPPHSEEPNDSTPNSDATRKISSSLPLFSQPVQSVKQEKSESKPVIWLLLGLGGLGLLVLFIVIIFVSSSNKLSDQKAIEQAIVMTQHTSSATDVVAVQPPTVKSPSISVESPTQANISSISFSVAANKKWQDTSVSLNAGQEVSITYLSGEWTVQKGTRPYTDAAGPQDYICAKQIDASQCVEPIPDYWVGGLIGKVGSQLISIGNKSTFRATETANLELRANDGDDGLYDNEGSVLVSIKTQDNTSKALGTMAPTTTSDCDYFKEKNSSNWVWYDPTNQSKYVINQPGVSISTQDGKKDIYEDNNNAPRLVKRINKDNFTLTTRVMINPSEFNKEGMAFQAGSLLVFQNIENFYWVGIGTSMPVIDGTSNISGNRNPLSWIGTAPEVNKPSLYLKIVKENGQIYSAYSDDQIHWSNSEKISFPDGEVDAGIVLFNAWEAKGFSANYDYVCISEP